MIISIIFVILLIVSSIYDLRTMYIPIWIVSGSILISIYVAIINVLEKMTPISYYSLTIFLTIIILIVSVLFRILKLEAIGFGDGLVMISINLFFGGERAIVIFCISFLISGIVSGVLMMIKRANRKTRIPFVPFLAAGTLIQLISIHMGEMKII